MRANEENFNYWLSELSKISDKWFITPSNIKDTRTIKKVALIVPTDEVRVKKDKLVIDNEWGSNESYYYHDIKDFKVYIENKTNECIPLLECCKQYDVIVER